VSVVTFNAQNQIASVKEYQAANEKSYPYGE